MAEETSRTGRSSTRRESAGVGDIVDLVKEYAKQETLGPLKGAGRWLALGSAGATFLGLGLVLVLLGILRLLQTEFRAFDGGFSWVPFVIVLVLCLALAWITLSRFKKATLGKEPN
jgi:hypothetical protein